MNIHQSWQSWFEEETQKSYFQDIMQFLELEKSNNKIIYPPENLIYNAFSLTPLETVKVVILGQDPYHRPNQAMGLSFSVPRSEKIPPSLRNIYKEIHRSLDLPIPEHGDLTSWAKQGVLMLNAMLTVEAGRAGSHRKIGWEHFTDAIISKLSERKENLVFMLWGNFARKKKSLIDENKHCILESAHPSPLARNQFHGNNHFIEANAYLTLYGKKNILWQV